MIMAYSSVRVQFEIGHEASVRTKKTPEGFTHDWEVFVRGADNTDIQCFVDKVVFHLHETFPKPRRVIKDPPYVVKESGYAGFVLPIDVYLKNKEEPKKISFQYDLTLQTSGPPISRVLREPRLFQNPSEDFRRKLIRGGGVGVDTPSEVPAEDLKSAPLVSQNKTKPAESPAKKHKPDQPMNHSFAELFGTPIRRVPEQKKLPELSKKLVDDKKKVSKPYKDEKEVSREKYSDRDKSKEKAKRPPSPLPPLLTSAKSKDEHKKHEEKEKKREEHEEKKKKREEKDKKEKTKDSERQFEKEHKKEKKENREVDFTKKVNSKPPEPKPNYEKHNNEAVEKEKERLEKEKHKHRHKKKEKEKSRDKEKHRKEKEKDIREREKEREKNMKKKHEEMREKEEKRRKSKSPSPAHFKKGPLNALLDELGSSDSASPLSEDESIPPVKPLPKASAKSVPDNKPQAVANVTAKIKSTNPSEPLPMKPDENNISKSKKEKSSNKKSKKQDKDQEKKKEKEEIRARSMSSERGEKEEEEEKEKEKEKDKEKEKANKEDRQEKEKPEEDRQKAKDKENRKRKREKSEERQVKPKKSTPVPQQNAVETTDVVVEESRRSDKFTKEYVAQLRDLQHRIMTLEDNAELQKVVKVIAETGQYEVTKKTFDFDLCALDMDTVKRLQEFFAPT